MQIAFSSALEALAGSRDFYWEAFHRRLPVVPIARLKSSVNERNAVVDSKPATVSPAPSKINAQPDGRKVVFHARGLSKIYRMGEVEVHALNSVDLDLYEGEFVVLLGPSGSGKSTLLNILGGLDTPTSGEVIFRDHNLISADDRELTRFRREHVGFVFQFYNLIPSLTARENVQLVTEISEHPMSAEEALRLVGLSERMDHFPAQMSGGEQQRVAIARAIAKSPDVLLCDEPTGALDYATGKPVLEVLERVNQELGTTTAVITHNAAIAGMADRVIRLGSGRIVEESHNEKKIRPSDLIW
jgi:putative ABC transport system ATP-binding protein